MEGAANHDEDAPATGAGTDHEIIVDIDDAAGEIVLVIHWTGGQHSELRVRKPRTGEHGCSTPEQALAVIRSMAGRWCDQDIAASLNRMGMPTGQGKTWTAHRVSSLRRVRGIHGYRPAKGRPCRVDSERQISMF